MKPSAGREEDDQCGRWDRAMDARGEYGVETLVMDDESREDLEEYLWQRRCVSEEN